MTSLRDLPQVDYVLRQVPECAEIGHTVARWIVRRELDAARARALSGAEAGDVFASVRAAIALLRNSSLRRVINATGVVLHTNLGRAPLSAAARAAILDAAGATSVEYDIVTGERGARAPVAATLAAALCGADDALIVNNNAAALLLALASLTRGPGARGCEAIVSRGELIEIGGEFRLPDVMAASGAVMREVGTTNRTHVRDYERALGAQTGVILKVHPSNYEVVGFTAQPSVVELSALSRAAGVPLLYDTGSGLFTSAGGLLADEPDASTALADGADLVCFSGDKLLGGPQAGVLAGRADLIERCRRHPLARAVRADKLTLAAMEATLWAHARGERPALPIWSMIEASAEDVRARATAIAAAIPGARVIDGRGVTGGGSVPGRTMPTALIAIDHADSATLAAALRAHTPPVIARIDGGRVVVDLRTVDPSDDVIVAAALARPGTRLAAALSRPAVRLAVTDDARPAVRLAVTDDARAIAEVHVRAWQVGYQHAMPAEFLSSLSVDHRENRWTTTLAQTDAPTWVATLGGRVVGFLNAGPTRDADATTARTGEVLALNVDPDAWSCGCGTALLARAMEFLRARGYDDATLWVLDDNPRARRLYEHHGWSPDGTTQRDDRGDGVVLDEVRYRIRVTRE